MSLAPFYYLNLVFCFVYNGAYQHGNNSDDDIVFHALLLLCNSFHFIHIRHVCFNAKDKYQNVHHPNTCKDIAWDVYFLQKHDYKSKCHYYGNGNHNSYLCPYSHSFTSCEGFEVFLVELCVDDPIVQSFRAFGKAKGRQHQKWKIRNHWKSNTYAYEHKADTSEGNKKYSFN